MNVIDWVRDKIVPPIVPPFVSVTPKVPKPPPPKPEILLPGVDDYDPLINDEVDNAWANAEKYGLPSASADFPLMAACTTAEYFYPIPIQRGPIETYAEWVCEWCGNMWPSDTQSCEKCGGPRRNDNDR